MVQRRGVSEERYQLGLFLERCNSVPEAEKNIDSESPDCIIDCEPSIGIEHTRLFHSAHEGFPEVQKIEGMWNKISDSMLRALREVNEGNLLIIIFHSPSFGFNRAEFRKVEEACVRASLQFAERTKVIGTEGFEDVIAESDLPYGFNIRGNRVPGWHRLQIQTTGGIYVPELTRESLQNLTNTKSEKLEIYKRKVSRVWLLIFADETRHSGMFDTQKGVPKNLDPRGFERVYFQSYYFFDSPVLIAITE